jgi:hypothetical protein
MESVEVYHLKTDTASEPADIIWANQAYTKEQLVMRKIISMLLTAVVLLTGFILITYLNILFVSELFHICNLLINCKEKFGDFMEEKISRK